VQATTRPDSFYCPRYSFTGDKFALTPAAVTEASRTIGDVTTAGSKEEAAVRQSSAIVIGNILRFLNI
jgi:hypothetical protein